MPEYPCVLIPQNIQRVQLGSSPFLPVPKTSPLPVKPKATEASTIVVGLSIAVITLFIANFSPLTACSIFFASIVVIVYNAIFVHRNHAIKKHDYKRVPYSDQHVLETYKENDEDAQILHHQNFLTWRQQKLIQELTHTVPHDGRNNEVLLGRAEQFFYKYLHDYFGDKIHTHLALNIPNYEYPYTPDFTYVDSLINLFIDIEIDEPYSGKKPIHYVGVDNNRNKFFLERGWAIIRFAEEQVVKHPKSCCLEIAKVIAGITGDSTVLRQFVRIVPLEPVKQWTKCEARTMSLNSFRNTYSNNIKVQLSGRKIEEPISKSKKKSQVTEYLVWKYSGGEWHHVGNTCDFNLTNSDRDSNTQIFPRGQRPK